MKKIKRQIVPANKTNDFGKSLSMTDIIFLEGEFMDECKKNKIEWQGKELAMKNNFIIYSRKQRKIKRNKQVLNRICRNARKKLWNQIWDLMFPNEESVVPKSYA